MAYIQYNGGSSQTTQQRSFLQRMADALVYVLMFPFIAVFIAMKNMFTKRTEPAKSYREQLPQGVYLQGGKVD